MPRARQRACLQSGLSLNLNRLIQRRLIQPGAYSGSGISWTSSYTGEPIASGLITADVSGDHEGWLRIQIGQLDQWISLVSEPRHFGGRQWYFMCPTTDRRASVLWKPPGARRFACRQAWGRQVAYSSQFQTLTDRAHQGMAKINSRLCSIGGFHPDEWDLPPKPKWMRWRTYNRAVEKFDRYEGILDAGLFALVAKLKGLI
jgi:hypothetical protein